MGKYPIFVVNQLSHGPNLVLEDINISFFLSLSITHTHLFRCTKSLPILYNTDMPHMATSFVLS